MPIWEREVNSELRSSRCRNDHKYIFILTEYMHPCFMAAMAVIKLRVEDGRVVPSPHNLARASAQLVREHEAR